MVLQTIALPTELPRRVWAQIREMRFTPCDVSCTSRCLHHGTSYTIAGQTIVLFLRVLRKRGRIARELLRRESFVIAPQLVHAAPATHLHDRGLGDAGLKRVARPGVAVAVLL